MSVVWDHSNRPDEELFIFDLIWIIFAICDIKKFWKIFWDWIISSVKICGLGNYYCLFISFYIDASKLASSVLNDPKERKLHAVRLRLISFLLTTCSNIGTLLFVIVLGLEMWTSQGFILVCLSETTCFEITRIFFQLIKISSQTVVLLNM